MPHKILKVMFPLMSILIIILYAIFSFMPAGGFDFYNSHFNFILWALIALLTAVYPFVSKTGYAFIFKHVPFIILLCAASASFVSFRSAEIAVEEGQEIPLKDIYARLKIKKETNASMTLKKFSIKRYSYKNKTVKSYLSEIIIRDDGRFTDKTVEVNKPFKFQDIRLFQKSWTLGVKEIRYELNGIEHDMFDQDKVPVKTADGNFFRLIPSDVYGDKILYLWEITDYESNIAGSGSFINNDPLFENIYPEERHRFKIIKEDYKLISIFQAANTGYGFYLLPAALLFLIALFADFWGISFVKRAFKK